MQLEVQKKKLELEKAKILKQLDYYKSEDPFLVAGRDENNTFDDDITEIEGHDRITATRLALKQDLEKVEQAISRIESGKYGICRKCGSKIDSARLSIMPTADLCLSCETKKR